MLQKLRKYTVVVTLVLSPVLSLMVPGLAHAASTVTWTGGGTDGNWSTTANWAGNVAPVNGDSVVIDNAGTFTNGSTDDIAGLSLVSITFTNNGGSTNTITLAQALTVTTAITQAPSVTATTDFIDDNNSPRTITLGGDVTVHSTTGIAIGDVGDTLALGGHMLTFTDPGSGVANITTVYANITGAGTVVYNGPVTDYQISGANTYSGTTHVIANGLPVSNTNNNNAFGSSSITIENGGSVTFDFATNTTISNPITVVGTANGSPVTSLGFGSTGSNITFTVPAITLNNPTRFSNDSTTGLTMNLAGITANGHCVEYLGPNSGTIDGPANGFTNGPAACIVTAAVATTAPKAPDTGFAMVAAHPVTAFAATSAAALLLYGFARLSGKTGKKATGRR